MPALLADIGGVFAVLFLLISFVGWIINMINAQNPPPAPNRGPQRGARARDRKVQNEIEQFLQEAMGKKGAPRDEVGDDEIELLEPPPQRRPPQRRPARAPAKSQQRPPAPQPEARTKPGSGVSSRHMTPSSLGVGVTSHVQDHMRERVSQETSQHLPHAVNQTVAQHLGDFTADDHDPRASVKSTFQSRANVPDPTGLIAALRHPEGMRKAILLQEILSKPRALRR